MSHTVKDLMSTSVISVGLNSSIKDALGMMLEHQVRHLPVIEDGNLRGIVSVSDIKDYALPISDDYFEAGSPRARLDEAVYTIMQEDVSAVTPETPVAKLIDYFVDSGLGAIPVIKGAGQPELIGIVSYIDVLTHARSFYK